MFAAAELMKTLEQKCSLILLFYCRKHIREAVSRTTLSVYDHTGGFCGFRKWNGKDPYWSRQIQIKRGCLL